jgi:ATP-dependent protease HslVU (ClpYQ) ATPase subunit
LIKQQVELMQSEQVNLTFTPDAIREIARVAHEVQS